MPQFRSMVRPGLKSFLMYCCVLSAAALLEAQDVSTEAIFAAVPFDRWAAERPAMQVPWKVRVIAPGLSVHQRLGAHVEIEIKGRELVQRSNDGRIVTLLRITDPAGHRYHDYGLIDLKQVKPEPRKHIWLSTWDAFVLPGDYKVEVALYDKTSGEHNFQQSTLHVPGLKDDLLPEAWLGLPSVEFWGPLTDERDVIFHSDIEGALHLPLRTGRPVHLEVLADLTPSDLFHGSTRFYTRYLSVMLPLMKAVTQIAPANGSMRVATLDLRRREVTFEQDNVKQLDWTKLKQVVAPGKGPGMIDIKGLEQKHETPDFLRDEVLRRLSALRETSSGSAQKPLHVFVLLGSPMDFYAFHHLPPIPPEQTEDCVVYYLQFELYNPQYASGALGSVRKMMKPLPIHTMQVRSPQSIRHALAKVLEEVASM
jgi:hypothetical protein